MKTKLKLFQARRRCAVALGIGLSFSLVPLCGTEDGADAASAKTPEAIPWSQIGAKAGADYQGDGLAVIPTAEGARLRCVFQQLEGEASREGLWLTSTVTNAANDRFRAVATAVGRGPDLVGTSRGDVPACVAAGGTLAPLHAARTAQRAVPTTLLPATGNVSLDGQIVRFTRPGLVEEYSVSMDGVRQDFVVRERPEGVGELAVRLAVSGAKVEPAAGGARLVLENSGRKIAYSRLRVTDATGRELRARMEALFVGDEVTSLKSNAERGTRNVEMSQSLLTSSPTDALLAVVVNDADAVYPVRIDPTFSDANWTVLGSGMNERVHALAVSGSNVYAGGSFSTAGFSTVHNIAKWNGSSWSALGSGTSGYSPSPDVLALAVSGNDLYVGGDFTTAGDSLAPNIAQWNGNSWSGLGLGIHERVFALAVAGNDLYAAGAFTNAGGTAANYVARWDGNSWSALGSGMDYWVYALAVSGSNLYAGGLFRTAGGNTANYLAKWDGNDWSALGSGMNNWVYALAVSGSDLYVGGNFATAGGKVSAFIAGAYLPTLPALSLFRSGPGEVTVSWPSADTVGFALEQAGTLTDSASWGTSSATVTDDGINKSVTLPATNSAQFFRLRRP